MHLQNGNDPKREKIKIFPDRMNLAVKFFHGILNSYIIFFNLLNSNSEIQLSNFSWFDSTS